MSSHTITYRREQLYEEVWAEPVRTVAQRYGISDVALAKICRKLAVPRPGVGYWAKVAAGRVPKRVPLPKTPRDVPEEITRHRWDREPSATARAMSAAKAAYQEVVEVATTLDQPHKLVAAAIRVLGRAKPDVDGLRRKPGRRCLDVTVSPATFDRAVLIMDALLRALEGNGMRCEVTDERRFDERGRPVDTGDVPPNTTRAFVDGEWCVLRLWEKYSLQQPPLPKPPRGLVGDALDSWVRWNRPVKRRIPNGTLELSLTQGYSRAAWKDGKRKRLEHRVGDVVAGLHGMAAAIKEARTESERRERERVEADRRYYEAQRRAEQERQRAEALEGQVGNWKRARDIREYVAAARALVGVKAGVVTDARFTKDALAWALAFADRIDPLSGLRPRPEPPRPAGSA